MSINTLICYHEPGESIHTHLTLEPIELSWKVVMAGMRVGEREVEKRREFVSRGKWGRGGGGTQILNIHVVPRSNTFSVFLQSCIGFGISTIVTTSAINEAR